MEIDKSDKLLKKQIIENLMEMPKYCDFVISRVSIKKYLDNYYVYLLIDDDEVGFARGIYYTYQINTQYDDEALDDVSWSSKEIMPSLSDIYNSNKVSETFYMELAFLLGAVYTSFLIELIRNEKNSLAQEYYDFMRERNVRDELFKGKKYPRVNYERVGRDAYLDIPFDAIYNACWFVDGGMSFSRMLKRTEPEVIRDFKDIISITLALLNFTIGFCRNDQEVKNVLDYIHETNLHIMHTLMFDGTTIAPLGYIIMDVDEFSLRLVREEFIIDKNIELFSEHDVYMNYVKNMDPELYRSEFEDHWVEDTIHFYETLDE